MSGLFRPLHGLVRRYWAGLERLLTAAGLAGLLLYLLRSLPAYPPYWDGVLAGAVFGASLGSPALGYFLAVAVAAYPLYHVSIYLMALFLAAALLSQRVSINNLGGLLLALASPLLGAIYLPWLAPLLGGLWWGPLGGALLGGLAALWGQLLFGMTTAPPDWLINLGLLPATEVIAHRFTGIDSLDTLWLLVGPFMPDPTTLLYLLLQAAAWAAVGGFVGALAEKPWAQARRPLSGILLAWAGGLALLGLQAGVALWLGAYSLVELSAMGSRLAFTLLGAALPASLLEILHSWVEYPMAAPARRRRIPVREAQRLAGQQQAADQRIVWPWLRRLFSRSAPGSGAGDSPAASQTLAPGRGASREAHEGDLDQEEIAQDSTAGDGDDRDDDLVMLEID